MSMCICLYLFLSLSLFLFRCSLFSSYLCVSFSLFAPLMCTNRFISLPISLSILLFLSLNRSLFIFLYLSRSLSLSLYVYIYIYNIYIYLHIRTYHSYIYIYIYIYIYHMTAYFSFCSMRTLTPHHLVFKVWLHIRVARASTMEFDSRRHSMDAASRGHIALQGPRFEDRRHPFNMVASVALRPF